MILTGTILETNKNADPPRPLGPGSSYQQPTTVHKTQCTGWLPGQRAAPT